MRKDLDGVTVEKHVGYTNPGSQSPYVQSRSDVHVVRSKSYRRIVCMSFGEAFDGLRLLLFFALVHCPLVY